MEVNGWAVYFVKFVNLQSIFHTVDDLMFLVKILRSIEVLKRGASSGHLLYGLFVYDRGDEQ